MKISAPRVLIILAAIALVCLLPMVGMSADQPMSTIGRAPLTNTNGTNITAGNGDLTGFDIDCQFTPAGSTTAAPCTYTPQSKAGAIVPGAALSASVTVTYPAAGGKACFRYRVKSATAVSDWSPYLANSASCATLAALVPSAPDGVTVTVTLSLRLTSDSPIAVVMSDPIVTRN